jgi:guanylate kinase
MRLILVGKGGSGKDYLRQKMEARGFVFQVSYTTRPPRQGEVNGKDYWFLSAQECQDMEKKGEWFHLVDFNGWKYGTTKAQFYTACAAPLFIMTPTALKALSTADRKNSFVIYLNPPQDVIAARLKLRNMPGDTYERRLKADAEQFAHFKDYDMVVTNPDF